MLWAAAQYANSFQFFAVDGITTPRPRVEKDGISLYATISYHCIKQNETFDFFVCWKIAGTLM